MWSFTLLPITLLLVVVHSVAVPTPALVPKRGLPFNNPPKSIQNWSGTGSQVNWAYNWDSYMDPTFPHSLEFVPMLSGNGLDKTTNWPANANASLSRGSSHLLSFNEPDGCSWGQSCITPQDVATAYRQ